VSEGVVVAGAAELGKVDKGVFVFPLCGLDFGSGDHVECQLGDGGGGGGGGGALGFGTASSGEGRRETGVVYIMLYMLVWQLFLLTKNGI
jgi:hypothetical protein